MTSSRGSEPVSVADLSYDDRKSRNGAGESHGRGHFTETRGCRQTETGDASLVEGCHFSTTLTDLMTMRPSRYVNNDNGAFTFEKSARVR